MVTDDKFHFEGRNPYPSLGAAYGLVSLQDVSMNSHDSHSVISVCLRQSKMDPFEFIHLGKMGRLIFPVAVLLGYMALRE